MSSPKYVTPREAPQPPSGLEGYLSKQGGGSSAFGRKNWKVRYFVLKNGVLSYFTDKNEAQANATAKGSFHVLSITSIKTMPQKDKKFHNQCHREICFPNRSLVVCCDQEDILKKWVDAINNHIKYERKTEHLKKIQIEAQMVEEEMSQQMSFSIIYNVLKRWITIEFQRTLQQWRLHMVVERYGSSAGEEFDSRRLKQQFEDEKKDEMKRFTDAVKEKWEDAVVSLKEEMQALKDENATLRAENNDLREQAGSSPMPSPDVKPAGDTVEVLRSEFVALMEAAASGAEPQSADPRLLQDMSTKLAATEADLKLQRNMAATAQEQAQQQSKRADALAARLAAAEDVLKRIDSENSTLRSEKTRSPSPRMMPPLPSTPPPPMPAKTTPVNSGSPKEGSSGWIARYKAIVNSPL